MEYLTGYTKQSGHVVLEKAVIKGIPAAMAVCGDLPYICLEEGIKPVTGESKGALAGFFLRDFTCGISDYGADYLQAAVFGFSTSPAGFSPVLGPGSEFGSGAAGILASGENAYVYVTEGSGMCIVRIADVFGKKRFVKCLSPEFGGEDVISLSAGSVLIACPEKWADEVLLQGENSTGRAQEDLLTVFNVNDISGDESLDRRIGEIAGEGFEGCIVALAVK